MHVDLDLMYKGNLRKKIYFYYNIKVLYDVVSSDPSSGKCHVPSQTMLPFKTHFISVTTLI